MRCQTPSSRARWRPRFSSLDLLLAALSPFLALYLRDAYILYGNDAGLLIGYWLISLVGAAIGLAAFGIGAEIPRYYSVYDLVNVVKAVAVGESLTCGVLFAVTRLEGIPRSTPAIHALILAAGLLVVRASSHLADRQRQRADQPRPAREERVILVGLNDLAVIYLKWLQGMRAGGQRVVGLLDDDRRWIGRSVEGVRILGIAADLEAVIDEFAVHGIRIDRVVVAGAATGSPDPVSAAIRRVCASRQLACLSLPAIFGGELASAGGAAEPGAALRAPAAGGFSAGRYFARRRAADFGLALALLILLLPLWGLACLLALIDVGPPVYFWQQRVGFNGRNFLLYKLRTLPAVSARGAASRPSSPSWIGRLLRRSRVDEFPQLLNVLFGDMALIGPRPLLPQDQPANPATRLAARPGITGWAQVHGGALLSAEEKEALDGYYVRHASPWLDLRVLAMTLAVAVRGDRRSAERLARRRTAPAALVAMANPSAGEGDAPVPLPS